MSLTPSKTHRRSGAPWNPFKSSKSSSSRSPSGSAVKSGQGPQGSEPQAVHNYYIYGGQGGTGGQGGDQGGGGGTGEGPVIHQHFMMNTVQTSSAVEAPQAVNHCPPASRIFHGRQVILDTLHQFFARDTQKQKIYVLHGLGGAGKTQIALKFIEEWTNFTDCLFVNASTTEAIETALKNIALVKQTGNSQDALSWLAGKKEDWLLFFDNADNPNINLHHFFPKCNHGNIIITSRNPNLRIYGGHYQVPDMEQSDAVGLLLKSAQQEESPASKLLALDIVKVLWFLPLAIVQAGAFILESASLDTYLDLFMKNRTELLKEKPTQTHDAYAWAVYTTWELSFSKLSHPAALFLQLCSFIHQEDISEEIFFRAANYMAKVPEQTQYKQRLQKVKTKFMQLFPLSLKTTKIQPSQFLSYFVNSTGEWNSLQFLKVTNELRAYSLVNFHSEGKTFSIHPLVHSWSQTRLTNPKPYSSCIGYYQVGQYTKAETLNVAELAKGEKLLEMAI
ncbi:P-loop containing nucleoside triphosphate hydrolase protein [Mycena sanguinolenta]|nr:P-loop containing nucleoside triphosphate hydrolase protein [Mycena sanguinolenta]